MSKDKKKSLQERVNRKKTRDTNAKAEADRKTQSNKARAKNAGKPGYDQHGNILSEVEKLRIRQAQERAGDWQNNPNFDREQGGWKAEDALKIITNVIKAVPALAAPLLQQTLQISQLHNDNKAGNVDEVWKIRNHPNYKSLPSNEQWLKNLEKARGMVQTADLRNLKKDLPPTGGKFGNIINQQAESYRGIDNDKLIELQRIAAPLLIKNI